jgi:hypothetical protein
MKGGKFMGILKRIFGKRNDGPNLEKATGARRDWLADNDPTSPYYWEKHVPKIHGQAELSPDERIDHIKRQQKKRRSKIVERYYETESNI